MHEKKFKLHESKLFEMPEFPTTITLHDIFSKFQIDARNSYSSNDSNIRVCQRTVQP